MKILMANYRYFISGGPEKYMFNIKKVFEQKGHQVVPFSIKSSKNVETEYRDFFVEPIGGMEKVYFKEYKKDLKTLSQLVSRSFYSLAVKEAFKTEIKYVNPDVVYILHFINKLSPSIIDGAKEMGKKVVVRLSDFFLLCPRFDFLYKQAVCEECLTKGLFTAIRKRCVQDSLPVSLIRVLSMYYHNLLKIYDRVDAFVCPSAFLAQKLIESGFDSKKIFYIPTFIDSVNITPKFEGDYILYFGRLTKEKGVEYLIKAMQLISNGITLKIVGENTCQEAVELQKYVDENRLTNIQFLGFQSGIALEQLIKNSKFVVVPSIWYDNMPNVILESFAYGKPVVASNIGSLPEVVDDGINGLLFKPADINELANKIEQLNDERKITEMGLNARRKVEQIYSQDIHYQKLINILQEAI